jgi:hypothetical protein
VQSAIEIEAQQMMKVRRMIVSLHGDRLRCLLRGRKAETREVGLFHLRPPFVYEKNK